MIEITCNKCQQTIRMDDAFAGGVCRCSQCGTIQTVPAHLKPTDPATTTPTPKVAPRKQAGKTLYDRETQQPSGLDQLADIVSSGGMGTGLRSRREPSAPQPDTPADRTSTGRKPSSNAMPIIIGGVIALVIAGVAVAAVVLLGGGPTDANVSETDLPPEAREALESARVFEPRVQEPLPTIDGPAFFDMPLRGETVIYVIDRGSGMSNVFSPACEAALASASSLGESRRFQLVFWQNQEQDPQAYPDAPERATQSTIDRVRDRTTSFPVYGRSAPDDAIRRALSVRPDTIVIISNKGGSLDSTFADRVASLAGPSNVRVHGVAISAESEGLRALAEQTGGEYRLLTAEQLTRYARQ